MEKKKEEIAMKSEVLTSAPPPWHSVATIVAILAFFAPIVPTLDELDEVATLDTFTSRLFPEFVSLKALGYARLLFATVVWCNSIYSVTSEGSLLDPGYLPASKLKSVPIRLKGLRNVGPLTHISWIMLGINFSLGSAIALLSASGREDQVSPLMLRSALVTWEIAAPISFLVSAVVRYAIWPIVAKTELGTKDLQHPRTLLMHNANVIFSLIELCLLGGLPIRFSDIALAPLYGVIYVLFTWSATSLWSDKENGPQFLYFFMDTTLGITATIALVVLLAILMMAYFCFAYLPVTMDDLGGGILIHSSAVVVILTVVCKFS